jgi:pyruvoyl-dependent arginine decarboxylase
MKNYGYHLVTSNGCGSTELSAFDDALCSANVGNLNLVKISSIVPPLSKKCDGLPDSILDGSMINCAFSYEVCREVDKRIVSVLGVAIPDDLNLSGVIMEHPIPRSNSANKINIVKEAVEISLKESMLRRNIVNYSTEIIHSNIITRSNDYHCVFCGCFIFEI